MHALLAAQESVGIVALDTDGHRLDAGFVAGEQVDDLRLEALGFGPAQVHAFEHFGPVLSFGAAGAGMDIDQGIHVVGFAAEEHRHLGLREELFEKVSLLVERFEGVVFAFAHEAQPFLRFLVGALKFAIASHLGFHAALFLEHRGHLLLIVPGVRRGNDLFDLFESSFLGGKIETAPKGVELLGKSVAACAEFSQLYHVSSFSFIFLCARKGGNVSEGASITRQAVWPQVPEATDVHRNTAYARAKQA